MTRIRRLYCTIGSACAGVVLLANALHASPVRRVRFVVVDTATHKRIACARVVIEDGRHAPFVLSTASVGSDATPVFDLADWRVADAAGPGTALIAVQAGQSATFQAQSGPPVTNIFIKVVATRVQLHPGQTAAVTQIPPSQIPVFINKASNDVRQLTQGQPSVASDSAGQQHIRGEHADITYVIDGVPLPDTLMGLQQSVVVPSTIQSLDMITGGFAPEFGGQTAAVLSITTLPGTKDATGDLTLQGGSYSTTNGDFAASGPLGRQANYVVDVSGTHTNNVLEPQQPDNQTAHNSGTSLNYFTKLRFTPGRQNIVMLTLSHTGGPLQVNNRTGLPSRFADVGQGFGFLGLRDVNGVRPDVTQDNAGALGAAPMVLSSQQAEGMDISQDELSEYGTLSWRRQLNRRDSLQLAYTVLRSEQAVFNNNPPVDQLNLPVDNSIEFNPNASRDVQHQQLIGSVSVPRGKHDLKLGFLSDSQSGNESYHLVPCSRLALDDLAAIAPNLAPPGNVQNGADGNPVPDVDGNPIYLPTSSVVPTLQVHRTGFYRAAYIQDTWRPIRPFTINYGLRFDAYRQALNLGQPPVDASMLSPRINFSYQLNPLTVVRWSYDRLFNTPPLAEGAIIGQPIQPERIHQYDVGLQRQLTPGQIVGLAYYYKQITNQIDTGLLIPGVWLGLYQSVNLQYGAVHGIEFSYDFSPPHQRGWDGYLNYTFEIASPNGVDSTGAPVAHFNDHDQRHTIGLGLAYLMQGGASAAATFYYGSGLASSVVEPNGPRTARTDIDLHLTTGPRFLHKSFGLGLELKNLLDERKVINFESGFSGTRFMGGRRVLLTGFWHF